MIDPPPEVFIDSGRGHLRKSARHAVALAPGGRLVVVVAAVGDVAGGVRGRTRVGGGGVDVQDGVLAVRCSESGGAGAGSQHDGGGRRGGATLGDHTVGRTPQLAVHVLHGVLLDAFHFGVERVDAWYCDKTGKGTLGVSFNDDSFVVVHVQNTEVFGDGSRADPEDFCRVPDA